MPSGGARSRSGPAPDPNALRRARKDDAGWTTLTAEPRTRPTPAWPLVGQSDREKQLWSEWWRKPISDIWLHNQEFEHVALVVRMFTEAEAAKSSAENRKTLRIMMADLRLTSDSMARARIRIVDAEPAEDEDEEPVEESDDPRDRFQVIQGGG